MSAESRSRSNVGYMRRMLHEGSGFFPEGIIGIIDEPLAEDELSDIEDFEEFGFIDEDGTETKIEPEQAQAGGS